jgi:hypothetical protein
MAAGPRPRAARSTPMPNRHYIQKLVVGGEPYVNSDNLADWVNDLRWREPEAQRAAEYIAQELRLMGLSDIEESLR